MRILLLGAGGPAGVNALRALRSAGHELYAADDNDEHLIWCEPYADCLYGHEREYDLAREVDLVLAQPDPLVKRLAAANEEIRTFLPSLETIERCQDKLATVRTWWNAGLRSGPVPIAEPWPDHLNFARDAFGDVFWLRASRGAGARGAIRADSIEEAFHWIRFWQTRGAEIEWIAEEFLPGRDLAWSSIWANGELVTSFLRERLEYLYPHLSPEGLTGTPTIARVVHDSAANHAALAAVMAIDEKPHGIYSVDLREAIDGTPTPTEINAGRGFTTLGLWSLYYVNFLDVAAHLGVGDANPRPNAQKFDALPAGLTLSRHVDCPGVFRLVQEVAHVVAG